jgi:hypothetical protein
MALYRVVFQCIFKDPNDCNIYELTLFSPKPVKFNDDENSYIDELIELAEYLKDHIKHKIQSKLLLILKIEKLIERNVSS